jgi:hypothetical protein
LKASTTDKVPGGRPIPPYEWRARAEADSDWSFGIKRMARGKGHVDKLIISEEAIESCRTVSDH